MVQIYRLLLCALKRLESFSSYASFSYLIQSLPCASIYEIHPCLYLHNVQTPQEHTTAQVVPTALTTSHLSRDQGEAVGGENLIDGLEVGGAAGAAVARASGGDTLSLSTGVERAARVAGLGANVGLGEAGDTSLGVVDRRSQGADGAAVDTGGGAGAADARADGRGGAA